MSKIVVFLFLLFFRVSFSQGSLSWKLYEVESGMLTYEVNIHEITGDKIVKKPKESIQVQFSFSEFGEVVLLDYRIPGEVGTRILKIRDSQYQLISDSVFNRESRKYDFDFEKIILQKEYHCQSCIVKVAKPKTVKYLSTTCIKYFMFSSKDISNSGTLTCYKGIPMEIDFKNEDETKTRISAKKIDFTLDIEISKLTSMIEHSLSKSQK